jgi:hypothetical protein
MKNSHSITVLVGLFVVLTLLVISQNTVQAPPLPPVAPSEAPASISEDGSLIRAFPELTVLDIQAIRLQNIASGAQLTLSRDSQGNWTAPELEGDLDNEAVTNIARTLVLLPYGRSINIVEDTDLDNYGFENSADLLFYILGVSGETHTIAVGDLTDSQAAYFALIDERDEIFQIERGAVDFLRNFIDTPPIRLTN